MPRNRPRAATAQEEAWEHPHVGAATRATVLAGRRPATGTVVESTSEHTDARVVVAFDPDGAPLLPIGRPVDVAFQGGAAGRGFDASGQVIGRCEDYRGVVYELFFPRAANRALSPLVNRRGALRVHPSPEAPVVVTLRAFDGEYELAAEAHDVSASGISVRVAPEVESRMATARAVELVVELPGDPIPRGIRGHILRRHLVGAFVHYGIHFEERGTVGEREAILQWVLARHRHELGRRSAG